MDKYFDKTHEFCEAMEQPVGKDILFDSMAASKLLNLRLKLIKEETAEVVDAVFDLANGVWYHSDEVKVCLANLLKELADLQYVLSGFAATFGLPLEEAFDLVHASNMSKLGDDGKPVYREDGKVMKGPNYKKPDLMPLVEKYISGNK